MNGPEAATGTGYPKRGTFGEYRNSVDRRGGVSTLFEAGLGYVSLPLRSSAALFVSPMLARVARKVFQRSQIPAPSQSEFHESGAEHVPSQCRQLVLVAQVLFSAALFVCCYPAYCWRSQARGLCARRCFGRQSEGLVARPRMVFAGFGGRPFWMA